MTAQKIVLDYLIGPSFQGVKILLVSLFADDTQKTIHKTYFVPFLSIQDHNFLVYDRNFIDQPVTNSTKTYENIGKIDTGQGDEFATDCFIDYPY